PRKSLDEKSTDEGDATTRERQRSRFILLSNILSNCSFNGIEKDLLNGTENRIPFYLR
ncbi:19144_t:CDS:1, partial [Racocetra persica]